MYSFCGAQARQKGVISYGGSSYHGLPRWLIFSLLMLPCWHIEGGQAQPWSAAAAAATVRAPGRRRTLSLRVERAPAGTSSSASRGGHSPE